MKATLENILCIIHRDGGHYIAEHGIQKAFDDALEIHYRLRKAEENLSNIVQQPLHAIETAHSGERCTKYGRKED
jgi:hypothetical protein